MDFSLIIGLWVENEALFEAKPNSPDIFKIFQRIFFKHNKTSFIIIFESADFAFWKNSSRRIFNPDFKCFEIIKNSEFIKIQNIFNRRSSVAIRAEGNLNVIFF